MEGEWKYIYSNGWRMCCDEYDDFFEVKGGLGFVIFDWVLGWLFYIDFCWLVVWLG